MIIPFFDALAPARRVLVAGCGGGFDVLSGLPLYTYLRRAGRPAFLANLSFSPLHLGCRKRLAPTAWLVDWSSRHMAYFPERHLVDWLAARGEDARIAGFEVSGVKPLKEAYEALVRKWDIDTIVLIDGGTDSLLKGDEPLLGTIEEDATSIVAVNELDIPRKFLVCLGFGVDYYHGICHYRFLENTAEMIRAEAFLGCVSITNAMPEGQAFLEAVAYLNERQPKAPSIVCNSIASAMRGEFGDYHATARTNTSELFINPLMALYWCYDLGEFARHIGFYDALVETRTRQDVESVINLHHHAREKRDWKDIPL